MKTIADLNALLPKLAELLKNRDHEIGESYYEEDEDGMPVLCEESETNYFTYEENGWIIEVTYECSGEWTRESGNYWNPDSSEVSNIRFDISEVTAYHYDEKSDTESIFENIELKEFIKTLDKAVNQ